MAKLQCSKASNTKQRLKQKITEQNIGGRRVGANDNRKGQAFLSYDLRTVALLHIEEPCSTS